jgi:hypothetical protein
MFRIKKCQEFRFFHFVPVAHYYTSGVTMVPCCMNSTVSTPFLSKKTVAIRFLADICLNVFLALVNVCASTAFTALWFQHSQMKPRFHHLL